MACPWSCACDPPPPLIKVASNTRPCSKLGGTTLNGREEGGQYYISQTCDQERFEARKVVFLWECLNIFATGCSYSMHCSWWQTVKMTFFAHCPSVCCLSAGISALTWLPITHCNHFFVCLLYAFFFLVYTAEAFLKIVGYGLRKYLLSGWNM